MANIQNGKLFACGNHSIEITKGMLHFGDPSELVCMIDVPTTLTVRDIIQFLNPSMKDIKNVRVVREVNHDSSYIILLEFRNSDTALEFYTNYDGMQFNSLEENICKLLYVTRVETFSQDPAKIEETVNCAVCLEKINIDTESIVTILCNHSFHAHCLSKWGDTSCPVCRYCQTPECQVESKCMVCSHETDSLWMCIICGFVACGRYVNGHAYEHFVETQHTYAMQLADNQVWDYVGDNYVHRLLTNKTDGKPVEIEGTDVQRQAEEKIEAVQLEYTYLLTQQLESQRKYYEKLLRDAEKQSQKKLRDAISKSKKLIDELAQAEDKLEQSCKEKNSIEKKLSTIQAKLSRISSELADERQLNKCLAANQTELQLLVKKSQSELLASNSKVTELEEQQRDLMFFLEARDKLQNSINKNIVSQCEIDSSKLLVQCPSTSSGKTNTSKNRRKRNNKGD